MHPRLVHDKLDGEIDVAVSTPTKEGIVLLSVWEATTGVENMSERVAHYPSVNVLHNHAYWVKP